MPHANPQLQNSSQPQLHQHQLDSSSLVQGNLQLLYLALKLNEVSQESKKQQLARQNYRQGQGHSNKVGAFNKDPVLRSDLDKFKNKNLRNLLSTEQVGLDDSLQQDEDVKKVPQRQDSLEQEMQFSQLLEKPLAKINQDKILKGIKQDLDRIRKSGSMIVEGLNCEGIDLRSLDLSMLIFKNCNFKGAKFSSMHNVEFHNDCNLEGSDWSGAELRYVEFGAFDTKNNSEKFVEALDLRQLMLNQGGVKAFNYTEELLGMYYELEGASSSKIEQDLARYDPAQQPAKKLLNLKGANFSGVIFNGFFVTDADFEGARFSGATFKINNSVKNIDSAEFYTPSLYNIDLSGAKFEFFDHEGKKIHESAGIKSLDLSSLNPELRGFIGNGGIVAKEYFDIMSSHDPVIIVVNADKSKIPPEFLFENTGGSAKTSLKMTPEKIDEVEKQAIEIGNEFFGRFGIKFVTSSSQDAKNSNFNIHLNIIGSDEYTTRAQNDNVFATGRKDSFIIMNEFEFDHGFEKILSHEMGHIMLFKHPMGYANIKIPAHMSYALPMGAIPDSYGNIMANNLVPMYGFSIDEQKAIEQYMNLFGRQAHIDQDFVNKIGIDSRGVRSYYNTDPRFNNIVEISPDIFDHNYSVVLMKPRHALAYCKSQDVYNCDRSEGENSGVAVIMMHKESGDVIAMNILAGENLRIKLNSQLIDAKVNDSCFKIFSKKGNDFFLENYLIGQQNPTEIIDISEIKQSGDNHSFPKKLNSFFPLAFLLSAVGVAGLASVVVSNPKGQVINHRETALGRGVHED